MEDVEGKGHLVSESMVRHGMDSPPDYRRLHRAGDLAKIGSSISEAEPECRTPTESQSEGHSATVPAPAPLPSGF